MTIGPIFLEQPAWLLLWIPAMAMFFVWQLPSRLLTGLRASAFILLILAMTQPQLRLPSRHGTIVVVADRSHSMPEDSLAQQLDSLALLARHQSSRDRMAVVSFGQNAVLEKSPNAEMIADFVGHPGPDASNLSAALEMAYSVIPPNRSGRVLVLSDGRWTGRDPRETIAGAVKRHIGVDYRLIERSQAGDIAVQRIEAPDMVAEGEAFTLNAWLQVPVAQTIEYELKRNDAVLSQGSRDLPGGQQRLVFRDRAVQPGSQAYTLSIEGVSDDPLPQNNIARQLVGIRGQKPILVIEEDGQSGTAELLAAGDLNVETRRPDDFTWDLANLSNYSGLLLENVSTEYLNHDEMETIKAWVRDTGAGLMLTGGRNGYARGGYYGSPLEEILPVSMELRREHHKIAVAVVTALDRSGSMAMPAGGGRTKMDLANLGAAEVVQLLSPQDEIGVVAVDSSPHTIVSLRKNDNKSDTTNKIRRIQSMGGGIFVFEALKAASRMLAMAQAKTRHMILFADAADAEQPGQYKKLLQKCRQAGITCSVIALGTKSDADARFLQDVAARGDGSCYFTTDPKDLPRLFAQDTFVYARNTFVEEATPVRFTGGLSTLLGQSFPEAPPIGGYNLCYLRPEALLSAVTIDENDAPLVASWQAGLGRVLCYTGQLDGQYTGQIASWQPLGNLVSSMALWISGRRQELPENMLLEQNIVDGSCRIRLHLDPESENVPIRDLPEVTLLRDISGMPPEREKKHLRWIDPVTLGTSVTLAGNETLVATVTLPERPEVEPVTLPPTCLPYSPEFQPTEPGRGRDTLEQLAEATGGRERIEMAGIWQSLPRMPRWIDFAYILVLSAALLFVLEIFERRTGWVTALIARLTRRRVSIPNPQATSEQAAPPDTEPGVSLSFWQRWRTQRRRNKADAAAETARTQKKTPKAAPESRKTKKSPPPREEEGDDMFGALEKASRAAKSRTNQK
jgi:Mg-chelatase subunit ChlD